MRRLILRFILAAIYDVVCAVVDALMDGLIKRLCPTFIHVFLHFEVGYPLDRCSRYDFALICEERVGHYAPHSVGYPKPSAQFSFCHPESVAIPTPIIESEI